MDYKVIFYRTLLGGFALLMVTPFLALISQAGGQPVVDSALENEAFWNTCLLGLGVVIMASLVGGLASYLLHFYQWQGGALLHGLMLLPLAFPAYVLGFIYLGAFGPTSSLIYLPVQGNLWALIGVLTFALAPYAYLFCRLGLSFISQEEVEASMLLGGGQWRFFSHSVWPRVAPLIVSAQVLILFETLADFGAASVINVPVVTTLIYKVWFDLFSFQGAIQVAMKLAMVLIGVLFLQFLLKRRQRAPESRLCRPVRPRRSHHFGPQASYVLLWIYGLVSCLLPLAYLTLWCVRGFSWANLIPSLENFLSTAVLGLSVACLVSLVSFSIGLWLRRQKKSSQSWIDVATIGYSLPGALLAVSIYGLALAIFGPMNALSMGLCLILGLSYKFLGVSMRPICRSIENRPIEVDEASLILKPTPWKSFFYKTLPYSANGLWVGGLLVAIEVMKEMPLTLMLAPSDYQSLSMQIFNLTSEGEWYRAALPSLLLVALGGLSVVLVNRVKEF